MNSTHSDPHPHSQHQYQVRFDWGVDGARLIGNGADVLVWVDVLPSAESVARDPAGEAASRTTGEPAGGTVGEPGGPVGEAAGTVDEAAGGVAASTVGEPGGPVGEPGGPVSEPAGAGIGVPGAAPLELLSSNNGSSEHRADVPVIAGSLRNRRAVAEWVLAQQGDKGDRFTVAIVAAGEVRDNANPRYALEDLLGAGAVIDALADLGIDYCSPEAAGASAAFTGLRNATGHLIGSSGSGQELARAGRRADIDHAIELDVSADVPVLREFR